MNQSENSIKLNGATIAKSLADKFPNSTFLHWLQAIDTSENHYLTKAEMIHVMEENSLDTTGVQAMPEHTKFWIKSIGESTTSPASDYQISTVENSPTPSSRNKMLIPVYCATSKDGGILLLSDSFYSKTTKIDGKLSTIKSDVLYSAAKAHVEEAAESMLNATMDEIGYMVQIFRGHDSACYRSKTRAIEEYALHIFENETDVINVLIDIPAPLEHYISGLRLPHAVTGLPFNN